MEGCVVPGKKEVFQWKLQAIDRGKLNFSLLQKVGQINVNTEFDLQGET